MRGRARILAALAAALIALALPAAARAAETAYALSGNSIVSENVETGAAFTAPVPITGPTGADTPVSIDVRPSTGELFLFTLDNSGNPDIGKLWRLSPFTGAAVPVGSPQPVYPFPDNTFDASIEFNPVSGQIRLVTAAPGHLNMRINPVTGASATDTAIAYNPGDPGAVTPPNIVATAHSNNFAGATSTTLYDFDFGGSQARLARQGSPGGTPVSPNTGRLFLIGPMGPIGFFGGQGLDASNLGTLYATATTFAFPITGDYFRVNPANGAVTHLSSGIVKTDFALARSSRLGFSATATRAPEGGSATVVVSRTGPTDGAASVTYATADGSAGPGDYTARSGTLAFAASQRTRSITIPLADDSADEGRESFTLLLGTANGSRTGGALPGRALTSVVIDDDDADRASPRLALARVPRSISRRRFLRGFTIRIRPSEAARLEVALQGTPRGRVRLSRNELTLFSRRLRRAAGTRRVRIKPKRRFVGKVRRTTRVRLRVKATDALGNSRVVTRTIRVKPDRKRRRR